MKTKLLILTLYISFNAVFAQKAINNNNIQPLKKSLELPQIQVIPIKDSQFNRQYELYIKLPEGYSNDNDIKYPVLYIEDAMWHLEILSGSSEYLTDNLILVGISWQKNLHPTKAYASRFRDYSIMKSSNQERQAKYNYGQAENHLDFIRNDVIKYVENNYQAAPDNRSYFGYSMSGNFGAYVLLTKPNTFKNYILGSSTHLMDKSFIYENESIISQMQKDVNANVYIAIGTLDNEKTIQQAKGLDSFLKGKDYPNITSKLELIEGFDHSSAFPMISIRSMYWLSDLLKDIK